MQKPQYQVMHDVEDTHFWYVGMRQITQVLLDTYPLKQSTTILDAGCGTGANLIFLRQYGTVFGVDISKEALRLCNKRGLKNIQQGSIAKLPFPNNTFNLVTCFDVLGHQLVHETQAISECYRVLKPGGILLLRVAAYPWLQSHHDQIVQNERRYDQTSLLALLKRQPFTVLRTTHANLFLFPLIALSRLWQKHSTSHKSDVTPLPQWVNQLAVIPLFIESWLLQYLDLPFGLSLIVIAQKPR